MFGLVMKIVLSHLLGDFVLQTNAMVNDIDRNRLQSKQLYFHGLIHLSLLLVITKFEKQYIFPVVLLAVVHLLIDIFTKIIIKNKLSSINNLLLDQLLHAISIALFVRYFYNYKIDFDALLTEKNYLLLIALISVTYVSSILMKKVLELFNYTLPNGGINEAGKYIGMLERLFVFTFVVMSFWEGIGFLLAAKSIFRFGDLKENKEIRLTEYILIGTLLSFGLAILIGQLYLEFKNSTN